MNLVEIIQNECIPRHNCMLTVQAANGDTGFVYFKDAQIIEANCGGLWGAKAFELIFYWPLASYQIAETPLGIKRTLWESFDELVAQIQAARAQEAAQASTEETELGYLETSSSPLQSQIQSMPGFCGMFEKRTYGFYELTSGFVPADTITAEWLEEFDQQSSNFGQSLDSGPLIQWAIEMSQYKIFKLSSPELQVVVIADAQGLSEEFDAECEAALMAHR